MEADHVTGVLNDLLVGEQGSLPKRLHESTVFVSGASAGELELLQRMVDAGEEHVAWLVEAIVSRGGAPAPRVADAQTADLHYVDLHHALPRLAADRQALVERYASASRRLGCDREAAALVSRILNRHQEELAALRMRSSGGPAKTPLGG